MMARLTLSKYAHGEPADESTFAADFPGHLGDADRAGQLRRSAVRNHAAHGLLEQHQQVPGGSQRWPVWLPIRGRERLTT